MSDMPAATRTNSARLRTEPIARAEPEPRSEYEHRIARGREPVAVLHRLTIGGHCEIVACHGAHLHEQRGARQVEVRKKCVRAAYLLRRANEDTRLALARLAGAVGADAGFQRAKCRGADGHHPSSFFASTIELPGCVAAQAVPLLVHDMVGRVLHFHGL